LNGEEKAAIALNLRTFGDEQEATNETGFSAVPSGFRTDGKLHYWTKCVMGVATEHNEKNGIVLLLTKTSV
jgi:hypothetical protein